MSRNPARRIRRNPFIGITDAQREEKLKFEAKLLTSEVMTLGVAEAIRTDTHSADELDVLSVCLKTAAVMQREGYAGVERIRLECERVDDGSDLKQ